jgi:hypothetical protein
VEGKRASLFAFFGNTLTLMKTPLRTIAKTLPLLVKLLFDKRPIYSEVRDRYLRRFAGLPMRTPEDVIAEFANPRYHRRQAWPVRF